MRVRVQVDPEGEILCHGLVGAMKSKGRAAAAGSLVSADRAFPRTNRALEPFRAHRPDRTLTRPFQ
jgi:hypothetical protein